MQKKAGQHMEPGDVANQASVLELKLTTRAMPVAKVPGCFTTQSPDLDIHLLLPGGHEHRHSD